MFKGEHGANERTRFLPKTGQGEQFSKGHPDPWSGCPSDTWGIGLFLQERSLHPRELLMGWVKIYTLWSERTQGWQDSDCNHPELEIKMFGITQQGQSWGRNGSLEEMSAGT